MSNRVKVESLDQDEAISCSLLMQRLVDVLDDVRRRLTDVQKVVCDYVETGELASSQMERLQNLDTLTQEVEAVRSVLGQIALIAPEVGDPLYGIENALSEVKLTHIRDLISHKKTCLGDKKAGDFTLF